MVSSTRTWASTFSFIKETAVGIEPNLVGLCVQRCLGQSFRGAHVKVGNKKSNHEKNRRNINTGSCKVLCTFSRRQPGPVLRKVMRMQAAVGFGSVQSGYPEFPRTHARARARTHAQARTINDATFKRYLGTAGTFNKLLLESTVL